MATPQGVAHVEAALELTARLAESIGRLEGADQVWRTEALGKLSATTDLLRGTLDRFYLKTRVCLPFARRCEEHARALDGLLAELDEEWHADAQTSLTAAIEKLAQAVRTLDERSLMQGMAIT
jgi:hypothetical protein